MEQERIEAEGDPTGQEPVPVRIPIDGTLDLHCFDPREVGSLVPHYLDECRRRGILQVRIVHGKGTGALRETVHALLGRLDAVRSYSLGGETAGGWGATIVKLRPPAAVSEPPRGGADLPDGGDPHGSVARSASGGRL